MNDKVIEVLLELLKDKSSNVTSSAHPFEIGKQYYIRTVTYHSTGKLKAIKGNFLILEKGAWIADSGRLNDALKRGFDKVDSAEIEPYEDLEWIINLDSIVDATEYPYTLPKSQK